MIFYLRQALFSTLFFSSVLKAKTQTGGIEREKNLIELKLKEVVPSYTTPWSI